MTLLWLSLALVGDPVDVQDPSGKPEVVIQSKVSRHCLTVESIEEEIPSSDPGSDGQLRVTVSATTADRLHIALELKARRRIDRREFVVRARDCPLVSLLISKVWGRFAADLARVQLPPASNPKLRPGWPYQLHVLGSFALGPPISGGARVGIRLGLEAGPAGGPSWAFTFGYGLVPDQPVDQGSVWVHNLWAGVGATLRWRAGPVPLAGSVLAVGGVTVGQGQGFDDDLVETFPLVRARLAVRAALPSAPDPWVPYLGVAAEASPLLIRFTGPSGGRYEEPQFRVEGFLGISLGKTWF